DCAYGMVLLYRYLFHCLLCHFSAFINDLIIFGIPTFLEAKWPDYYSFVSICVFEMSIVVVITAAFSLR
ncbi:hypothetical protein L9F63_006083, partial [Diploptera punctata]